MNFHTMTENETVSYIKDKKNAKEQKNVIRESKKKSLFSRFIAQFSDFMIILLLIAAGISFGVSFLSGEKEYIDSIIILAIVVINAVLGVVEEYRADNSLMALKKMSAPMATVRRGSNTQKIRSEDVRVGDILVLKMGDYVCADGRLLWAESMEADESAMSGEAMPGQKMSGVVLPKETPLAERKNMVYSGTSITRGKGEALVVAVGMDTEMGKIAGMMLEQEEEETPLQRKLASVGKALGIGAVLICVLIFFMGMLKRIPVFSMFLTSVSLAVAAIPEGLPAIVTVVLSIGVQKMAKQNAIVKHLSAVETLGGATVICTDKTGTLTENKMAVERCVASDQHQLFEMAILCCDDGENPTERAIINKALKMGIKGGEAKDRLAEIPFDSDRKMMSVMVRYYGKNRVISKGAIEALLPKCTHIIKDGQRVELQDEDLRKVLGDSKTMAEDALRVIAVAYKDAKTGRISESELTFTGLIGIIDPPRPEASGAVAECKRAGIKTVMITGDNKITAEAIGKSVGIVGRAITGNELSNKTDEEIRACSIFARVTPSDKLRIVKAFKKAGHIVAMTGDGVNDAPALKAADIGLSMGKKGTEVAKEASDLVLVDDNFATIVSAVRFGRGIFENIKKSIQFLLSSNIGEIVTIFVGLMFGWEPPLVAIQLLWVNLVTDSLPALALGVDPVDSDIMDRKPRDPKLGLFSGGLWGTICMEGAMIGALALLAFSIGKNAFGIWGSDMLGRTMAFSVLSMSQLFHAFNMRSEHSVIGKRFFENPMLLLSLGLGVLLQITVVSVPLFANIFGVVPLDLRKWGIVFFLSVLPIIIVEIQKLFTKKVYKE